MEYQQNEQSLPPPMWCLDPAGTNRLRWWDGLRWTDHYAEIPAQETAVSAVSEQVVVHSPSPTPSISLPSKKVKGRADSPLSDLVASATLEDPRYPLEEQIEVVGETYRIKEIRSVFKEARMPITDSGVTLNSLRCILVPEPWNEQDPNAVAVMVGLNHVGYLAADLAPFYTDGLQRLAQRSLLATGEARIWAKSDNGMVRARVTILIPEACAFD